MTDSPNRCRNVGELTVGGKVVGLIRCDAPAGHDLERPTSLWFEQETPPLPGTPHRATLEWSVEGHGVQLIDWPEANDPDEHFDVEVPIVVPPADDEG